MRSTKNAICNGFVSFLKNKMISDNFFFQIFTICQTNNPFPSWKSYAASHLLFSLFKNPTTNQSIIKRTAYLYLKFYYFVTWTNIKYHLLLTGCFLETFKENLVLSTDQMGNVVSHSNIRSALCLYKLEKNID